jgi:hypothetical protein
MAPISSTRTYSAQEIRSLLLSWIEDEKKSAADYQNMYDITKRPEFLQMSNDEFRHMQNLQRVLKDLEKKEGIQKTVWNPLEAYNNEITIRKQRDLFREIRYRK